MKRILLFGGTTEARSLLRELEAYRVCVDVCVVSEYGKTMLPEETDRLFVRVGRLDEEEIVKLMSKVTYCCVIDATHPYAAQVSRNLKYASEKVKLKYLRLNRDESAFEVSNTVASVKDAARRLEGREGNVLITTGSKELKEYTEVPGYEERFYVRVLPTQESIGACVNLGFPERHLIAMHGPFTKELNVALMRQFHVRTLVTKDGGANGGFFDTVEATKELGAELIVIRRPADEGLCHDEVLEEVTRILEEEQ